MTLIGIAEAAKRAGMTGTAVRRALVNEGYKVVPLSPRFYAVEEAELDKFLEARQGYAGRGRPKKKTKETAGEAVSE